MSVQPADFGPLEPLLADPEVTVIEATAQQVSYEKAGRSFVSYAAFDSADELRRVIGGVLQAGGVDFSPGHAEIECTLTDGTKVRAHQEPPVLSLYKAPRAP